MARNPYGSSLQPCRWRDTPDHLSLFARITPSAELACLTVDHANPTFGRKWEKLPPIEISGFAAVPEECAAGNIVVGVKAKSGTPAVIHQKNGKWQDWISLGGRITGWPAMSTNDAGDSIFVRGISGRPFYKARIKGGVWDTTAGGWHHMGGKISGNMNVVTNGEYTVVSALSAERYPMFKWQKNGIWHPAPEEWTILGRVPCAYTPVLAIAKGEGVYLGEGRYSDKLHFLYSPDEDRRLHYRRFDLDTGKYFLDFYDRNSPGQSSWAGSFILDGHPSLAVDDKSWLRVVMRSEDGGLFFANSRFHGGGLVSSSKESLGGQGLDSPKIIRMADPVFNTRAFVVGISGRLFTQAIPALHYKEPGLLQEWQLLSDEFIRWRPW